MALFYLKCLEAASQARAYALLLGLALLSSCSTSTPVASQPRFTEADAADFIAKYYSDQTSYVLKPVTMGGSYQTICDLPLLLKLARQQPGRGMAVIVLVHYVTAGSEEPVRLALANELTGLGYRRIVFLRGGNGMQVNGLPVLEGPLAPATIAGK
jgi:hypothetical protein